jgi:4-amino-4-deoxy-L-arabinose transferase-like glycosyltransferase
MGVQSLRERRFGALTFIAASALFFAVTAFFADRKLLWFDELFTVLIAKQPDWSTFRAALTGAGDLLPPGIHTLTRLGVALFGEHHVVFRLPAMVGFWLMLVCVYAFVRHRCSRAAAWSAVLVPLASGAYWYGFEARPYGVVAGACALALLAWQRSEGSRRTAWLIVLGASVVAALLLHWYAVILVGVVGVAELVRQWSHRRQIKATSLKAHFEVAVPAVLASAVVVSVPLLYPYFRHSQEFRGIIGPPDPLTFVANGYELLLGSLGPFLLALCVVAAWARSGTDSDPRPSTVPAGEVVAAVLFAGLPLLSLALAWTTQSQALPRYSTPGILGCAMLVGYGVDRAGVRRHAAVFCLAILCAATGANLIVQKLHLPDRRVFSEPRPDFALLAEAQSAHAPETLVVPDGLSFIRLAYYGDLSTARRLMHVQDDRVLGSRALGELSSFVPLRVVDAATLETRGQERLGVYDIGLETPLLARLAEGRLRLRVVREANAISPFWNLYEMQILDVAPVATR